MEHLSSHQTDLHEILHMGFFENLSNKCKFPYNLTTITITLHAHLFTFMKVSPWILLRMRNVSEKNCAQNDNAFFFFMFRSFSLKILPFMIYGTAGKATDDNIIRSMRFACCVTMATNTHTHTHTRRICNTYSYSMNKRVTRTCPNVTLYVYCLFYIH